MRKALFALLLVIVVPGSPPLRTEATAAALNPASCSVAEELGWQHWGWSMMCMRDFERMNMQPVIP